MKLRAAAVVGGMMISAGCVDAPTPPDIGFNGSLSFTYTGAGGGTHSANGDITTVTPASFHTTQWAYGIRSDADLTVGIVSNQPRTLTTHDMAIIAINRITPGSASISASCDPEAVDICTGMFFYRTRSNQFLTYEHLCIVTSGTINITAISTTRAQGTFSGSGFCFDNSGADQPFSVTNGSFNVALVSESQLPGA